MEKDTLEKLVGILLIVVSILIILLLVGLNLETLMEASVELSLIAVDSLATLGLKLLVFPQKSILEKSPVVNWTDAKLIQSAIQSKLVTDIPDLSYLNIHYSRRNDTANKPHRPYYIVNSKTKKAYWVRTELLVLNRRLIISSNTHENETELMRYLKENGIELVRRNSNLGELS